MSKKAQASLAFRRLQFDMSPAMNQNPKVQANKEWNLSYNEASLTNYTQFGVKSK